MKNPGADEGKTKEEVVEEAAEEESTTPEPEQSEEKPEPRTFDELKVVIILRNENVMIGIQSPDCDPVYETLKGTLAAALKKVPKIVDKAKQQWMEKPRYPKADLPAPPQPVASSSTATRSSPKQDNKQPSFF